MLEVSRTRAGAARIGWLITLVLSGCPHMNESDPGMIDAAAPDANAADAATRRPDDAGHVPSDSAPPPAATHSGLISIQDIAIVNVPGARAFTVQAFFTALRRPDYEEKPGAPDGCKVWSYDLTQQTPPPPEAHGVITLSGVEGGPISCGFQSGQSYVCPGEHDAPLGFLPDTQVRVALTAGGGRAFADAEVELTPGEAFTLGEASAAALVDLPLESAPLTLDCGGEGGSCGQAAGTIVRITTTDTDTAGLKPTAMPPPRQRYVEISCAVIDGTSVTIPAEAMAYLVEAHAASPFTRIRTAYMRDDVALVNNPAPLPPNRVVIAAGRGMLGFSDYPPREGNR